MQCAELCILTNPQVQEDVMVFLRSIRLARNRLKEAESRREASEATVARLEAELECLKTEESSKLAAVNADEARLMKAIAEDDMNMGHGLERIQDTASWLQSTIAEVRPPVTWRHGMSGRKLNLESFLSFFSVNFQDCEVYGERSLCQRFI